MSMTVAQAEQVAREAVNAAVESGARFDEQSALHLEITYSRQEWEKTYLERRQLEGGALPTGDMIGTLSEMAYRKENPEKWDRYIELTFALRRAEHVASTAIAAAQSTAAVEQAKSREKYEALELRIQERRQLEGE